MNRRKQVSMLLVSVLLLLNIPAASSEYISLSAPPPIGDWWVDDNTFINDTSIVIKGNLTINGTGKLELVNTTLTMNGNITVFGNLILKNVTLIMNCTVNGSFGIVVEPSGLMYIFDYDGNPETNDGSLITSGIKDGHHAYTFRVRSGSKFRMENSVLQECGYGDYLSGGGPEKGLFIETSNVQIKNVTVNKTKNGIIFNSSYSTNNLIYNCSFISKNGTETSLYGTYGVILFNSSNNIISQCKFYDIFGGILVRNGSNNNTIKDCQFDNSDPWINISKRNWMVVISHGKNNQILNVSGRMSFSGIAILSSSDCYVNNFTHVTTINGIAVNTVNNITLENINITGIDSHLTGGALGTGINIYQNTTHLRLINITIIGSEAYGFYWTQNQNGSDDLYFKNCYVDVSYTSLWPYWYDINDPTKRNPWIVKNVLVEDSYFRSELNSLETFYKLQDWKFKNSTFVKNGIIYRTYHPRSNVGIYNDATNISFDNCRFDYTGDMSFRSDAFVISQENIDAGGIFEIDFNNSVFSNSKNGIYIYKDSNYPASSLTLNNSSIYGNVQDGINLFGNGISVNIRNSNISKNENNGVHLDLPNNEPEVILKNTTITNNNGTGIFVDNVPDLNLYNSQISKNKKDGILGLDYANITINGTVVTENGLNGFKLTKGKTSIYNSIFSRNNLDGIFIDEPSGDINISGSEISYNNERGINIDSKSGNRWGFVIDNKIHNNIYQGIYLINNFGQRTLVNNSINNNGKIPGNQLYAGSTHLKLYNNNITASDNNNLNTQIFVDDAGLTMENNTLTIQNGTTSKSAVSIIDSQGTKIRDNIIKGNFSSGIFEINHPFIDYDKTTDHYDYDIIGNDLTNYNSDDSSFGIYLHHNDDLYPFHIDILNNTISSIGNKGTGIYLWSNVEPYGISDIYDNSINNWNIGMEMKFTYQRNDIPNERANLIISRNSLNQNNYGLILDASDTQLENNTVKESNITGILIEGKEKYPLIDNKLFDNEIGIVVEGSAELYNNIFSSNSRGLRITRTGSVDITNSTFTGNNKSIEVEEGKINSNNNEFIENNIVYSIINTQESSVVINNEKARNNNIFLFAEDSVVNLNDIDCVVDKSYDENNTFFVYLINSILTVYNSSITGLATNFKLDESSICNIVHSNMKEGLIDIEDINSKLTRKWFFNLSVVDSNQSPLSDVSVNIYDQNNYEHFKSKTPVSGNIKWVELSSMEWDMLGSSDPNPYKVVLSKHGYGKTAYDLDFNGNTNSTFTAYKLSELIINITAYDTPDDQGGSITVEWETIPILNFGKYRIFYDVKKIEDIYDAKYLTYIANQSINSLITSQKSGIELENGITYYFAISIEDDTGYMDDKVIISSNSVIPLDNLNPLPVKNLTAFDTPDDNGDSIILSWEPSNELDIDYFAIYCSSNSTSFNENITDLEPNLKVFDRTQKEITIDGLLVNTPYYVAVLTYDLSGNVNLSIDIFGPVIPIDNIPPKINREASRPSSDDVLTYGTDDEQLFVVFLSSNEKVIVKWYLDGTFQMEGDEQSFLILMKNLSIGTHNVTAIVEESSGLIDSLEWNFTVADTSASTDKESTETWLMLTAFMILILLIIILILFGFMRTRRKRILKRNLRLITQMDKNQAVELIDKRKEEGDRFTLVNLIEELPGALKNDPDKLLTILCRLCQDEITAVRIKAASNLAKLLDKEPAKVFVVFNKLQKADVKHDIYQFIHDAARTEIIKNLADVFYKNLVWNEEEEIEASLNRTVTLFQTTESFTHGKEMSLIYSALSDLNNYRTVSSISTSKPIIDKIIELRKYETEILHPEIIEVFEKMSVVAETIGKYEKVEGVEDKLLYLYQALNNIEEAFKLTRDGMKPPERDLFFLVFNSWRNIISLSIKDLRGRADLKFVLKGKEVIRGQEKVTLLLELENTGRSLAERIIVELVPSNNYAKLSKAQEIKTLGHKRKKDLTFELKPNTTEAFRVEFSIRYDDAEKREKSISFGDLVMFIDIGAEFQVITNPYNVGTPIATGSSLFVGRRDLLEFIQKNLSGTSHENIIVLIGQRRTGKTTVLRQLPLYLDRRYIPIYIDIQGIIDPGMDAFFYLLANEIVNALNKRGIEMQVPPFENFKERPSFYFEHVFLKEVYGKQSDSILVVMFDEFEELELKVDSNLLDKNIFSYLRHLMQHAEKLTFIFTGSSKLEDLKTDYWSIMFNIALYKRISFLSMEECEQLIREPVKDHNMIYDSLAVEKIYRLTSGHPYFIQLLCHALVNLHNSEKKNYITIQDVNGEIERILERGQVHFDFIWEQSTIIEKLVLTAFTRVFHEEETVTVSSVVNKLLTYGISVNSNEIAKALHTLASKDILTEILDKTTTYDMKIDLIRLWLEHTKNLDQVVEEYKLSSKTANL